MITFGPPVITDTESKDTETEILSQGEGVGLITQEQPHVFTKEESEKITEALCTWIDEEGEEI